MRGFAVSPNTAIAGITTSYAAAKFITLGLDATKDAKSSALPSSGRLSHLEITLTATAGTPANVSARLCWDSAGDVPITDEAVAKALVAALTTANTFNTAIRVDLDFMFPALATAAGKMYLFLKVDAGTVTATTVRLCWRDIGPQG